MPVTRDPEFPAETAQLMQAFNTCADGHDTATVMNAGLQLVGCAIGFIAKAKGGSQDDAQRYLAEVVAPMLSLIVRDNWDRLPQPSDVPVRQS